MTILWLPPCLNGNHNLKASSWGCWFVQPQELRRYFHSRKNRAWWIKNQNKKPLGLESHFTLKKESLRFSLFQFFHLEGFDLG